MDGSNNWCPNTQLVLLQPQKHRVPEGKQNDSDLKITGATAWKAADNLLVTGHLSRLSGYLNQISVPLSYDQWSEPIPPSVMNEDKMRSVTKMVGKLNSDLMV